METWRATAASPPITLADGDQGLLQDKGRGRGLFRPPHPPCSQRIFLTLHPSTEGASSSVRGRERGQARRR